jgi:radical SAM superfamily enzyme YgiQ (UPF0313 family)
MKYDILFVAGKLFGEEEVMRWKVPPPAFATMRAILNKETKFKSRSIDLSLSDLPHSFMTLVSDRNFKPDFTPVCEFECLPLFIGIKNEWDKKKKLDFNFLYNSPFKEFILKNGFPVNDCIFELKTFTDKMREIVFTHEFSSIGISIYSSTLIQAELICLAVREKDPTIPIIIGGPQVILSRLTRNIFLKGGLADFAVTGEGEVCIAPLVESLVTNGGTDISGINNLSYYDNGRIIETERKIISDLNSLPFPDYSDVDFNQYSNTLPSVSIYWSKGCINRCKFCSEWNLFSPKLRYKSPEYAVEEINFLMKKYGIIHFLLGDSLLDFSDRWMNEFSDLVEARNMKFVWQGFLTSRLKTPEMLNRMKKNGLCRVTMGLESADNRIFETMNKGHKNIGSIKQSMKNINNARIAINANQIVGYEGETEEIFLNNLELLSELIKENDLLNVLNIQPAQLRPDSLDYQHPSVKVSTFQEIYPEYKDFIPSNIFGEVQVMPMKYESPTIPSFTTYNRTLLLKEYAKANNKYDRNLSFFGKETDFEWLKNYYIRPKYPIVVMGTSPYVIKIAPKKDGLLDKNEQKLFISLDGKKRIIDYLEDIAKEDKKEQMNLFENLVLPLIVFDKVILSPIPKG